MTPVFTLSGCPPAGVFGLDELPHAVVAAASVAARTKAAILRVMGISITFEQCSGRGKGEEREREGVVLRQGRGTEKAGGTRERSGYVRRTHACFRTQPIADVDTGQHVGRC